MIEKRVLCHERARGINGSFGFLEHRFWGMVFGRRSTIMNYCSMSF